MGDCVPGHRQKTALEIIFDLQRFDQTGIRPLSNPVVRPKENIGTFPGLGGRLELLGDLFLGFNFDRNADIPFESFPEFA